MRESLENVATPELQQWAAFFAATVEELCIQDGLSVSLRAMAHQYILPEPWYLEARTKPLRKLQEETTPEPFKRRNVLGGG